jgi:predicted nucleic acid-binding protein
VEKVFVDSDIVLDLLSARQPHYKFAAELFSLADQNSIKVYISSLTFANVNYILSKQLSPGQARKMLLTFKTIVNVLAVNDKIIELALLSNFQDFEDAIQYNTAIENTITTLLTQNLKDYKKAEITILTAQQYLKAIE